jgi:phage host-nuclease inhibitor protein Gam
MRKAEKKHARKLQPVTVPDRLMRDLYDAEVAIREEEARLNRCIGVCLRGAEKRAARYLAVKRRAVEGLESWWDEHRPTGDGAPKSVALMMGRIGVRKERDSVSLMVSEAEAIAALRKLDGGAQYVRTPDPELDRAAILRAKLMLDHVITIDTGADVFFAEPSLSEIAEEEAA